MINNCKQRRTAAMWEILPGAAPGDKSELTEQEELTLAQLYAQPERYKGEVLPVGIKAAERTQASRMMQRKRDAEPVQSTMFGEAQLQPGLF